ncbi:unnamed protein product [Rotaria magnacalcarata]
MVDIDELCQFARLGQTLKIQKYLQTHIIDINALNLYGESALSTATYHNQISSVEYLLANKADPKLRLSAGYTAVHIACRLANVPILHRLLSTTKDAYEEEKEQQHREDKHVYDCLRMADNSNLTPIHWAARQESVSKRQKIFAYLDQRMPGVLDSRYNNDWFIAWAQRPQWILEEKRTKNILPISPTVILTNTDRTYQQQWGHSSLVMTPNSSLHDYEPTPTTVGSNYYNSDIEERRNQISSPIEHAAQAPKLPSTPVTSRKVAFTNEFHKQTSSKQKKSPVNNSMTTDTQKTPYFQRLSSILKHSLSPRSDRSTTYRAERAHVIPTFNYPSSPTTTENKRPSHNLLSNILPSTTSSSSLSDQSSQQSTKSFVCDTSMGVRRNHDTTVFTTLDAYTKNYVCEDEDNDYLCKSTSTLSRSSPGAYSYDIS